jgi:CRISPR-associated protein Cmr4
MVENKDKSNDILYHRDLYIITARTNMHVGSGEEAYGLVDNRVQRDVVTHLPNINASGLKGALREHFSSKYGDKHDKIIEIFGTDSFSRPKEHQAGRFRFFNANLLSMPVRSDIRPFFRATSPEVIAELLTAADTFGYNDRYGIKKYLHALADLNPVKGQAFIFTHQQEGVLEDFDVNARYREFSSEGLAVIKRIIGQYPALMNHQDFSEICDDFHLPLIARNHLENGRSQNLWHEQVVPRETRFYFFLLKPGNCPHDLQFLAGEPVQVGGNASIGYGFTEIHIVDDLFKNPDHHTTEQPS